MAYNVGDRVSHPDFGVGRVAVVRGVDVYWVAFTGRTDYMTLHGSVLVSRPDLRENNEGRRWCRPPVGVHKPYR